MGHVTHHAIIVTSWETKRLASARAEARKIFGKEAVTTVAESQCNGYSTFMIAPDGSKFGWNESDEGDMRRNAFIEHLKSYDYEDGSSPLEWVEVAYGHDDMANGKKPRAGRHG